MSKDKSGTNQIITGHYVSHAADNTMVERTEMGRDSKLQVVMMGGWWWLFPSSLPGCLPPPPLDPFAI